MQPDEQHLDISGLIPDFSAIFSFTTAADLSAFFVAFLLFLFVLFLIVLSWSTYHARSRINWLMKNFLGEETESTVLGNRNDLLVEVEKRKGPERHLWEEFDETLIETKDGNSEKLCNVYDADYFFNASSLAPGITESRLMAAVPGFLTAIGVIGTFVGLQLGLSELNIGNDVAVEEMKAGLAHVISGAKLAFMTSVWGVFLSVAFNFIEKWFENGVRKKISRLQVKIDAIFPRMTAEMQLKRIADDGYQSREALQGLAEQIGNKMQESLLEVTTGIQQGLEQSLQNVMGPAMDRLVNDASDGSQKALEQLIESFMNKFGQQGAAQRESMDSASRGVNDAVESMNQALNGFISNLNKNQQAASEREQGLIRHISEQVDELVEKTTTQQQQATHAAEEQLQNFGEVYEKQARTSVALQNSLTNKMKEQVTDMADHNREQQQQLVASIQQAQVKQAERDSALGQQFESTIAEIKTAMQNQIESTQNLLTESQRIQTQMANNSENLQKLARSIYDGAAELTRSTASLKEYGATLQQASTKLSTSILSASESTESLASENQRAAESVSVVREQIQSAITAMERTADNLGGMVKLADNSFQALEMHQNQYLATLKENIEDLADQGTRLLSEYAEQANGQTKDHLQIWAQSANDYAAQMKDAVQAIASVVDEIENKVKA